MFLQVWKSHISQGITLTLSCFILMLIIMFIFQVMSSDDGKSRGFGFVCYEDPDAAERACDDMHAKDMNGKTLFVGRAQKRNERQTELRRKFEQMKIERLNRYQGVNLYVKNLDDTIDDERLRKEFAPYGTITSAKVMTEGGRNKGGFQTSLGKRSCSFSSESFVY